MDISTIHSPVTLKQEPSKQEITKNGVKDRKVSTLVETKSVGSQTYKVLLRSDSLVANVEDKSKFGVFGGFIILVWTVVLTTPITLWPQTNVIRKPEYWYEPLGPIIASHTISGAACHCLECWTILKIDNFMTCSMFLKQIVIGSTGFVMPYITCYVIWVHVLEYRHPMPRIGDVCLTLCYIFRGLTLWWLIWRQKRFKDKISRQRLLAFLSFFPFRIFLSVIYLAASTLFQTVSQDTQWCVAFLFPIIRKLGELISIKIGIYAAGEENTLVKLALICHVACLHTITLSALLGSEMSSTTAYILMLAECFPNVISAIKTFQMNEEKQKEALKCLTLKEFLEVLIPMAYSISFLIAYYGPNAEIIGNVKNDYWQYKKVTDVFKKFTKIGILLTVDAIRAITISFVLGYMRNLNMFKTYCQITNRHGFFVLAYVTAFLNLVFSYYSIRYQKIFSIKYFKSISL